LDVRQADNSINPINVIRAMSKAYYDALKKYSKNQPYIKGRNFEYRVMRRLRKMGYFVHRKFGSKGHEDLIAFNKRGDILLIQCKWSSYGETKPQRYDLKGLIKLAEKYGAFAIFAGVRKHRMYFKVWHYGRWINAKLD